MDYGVDYSEQMFGSLMVIFGVMMIIVIIISITAYILYSLGLYGMAQRRNIDNAFLSWIPIGQFFILEKLIGSITIFDKEIKKIGMTSVILLIITMVLGFIPIIGFVLSLPFYVFIILVQYNLYKAYKSESSTFYLILTIFGFAFIPMFMLRNKLPELQTEVDLTNNDSTNKDSL